MSFNFSGTPAAGPAPAPSGAGGFSFGAPPAAPATFGQPATAPASSGFSFAGNTPAPASTTTGQPAAQSQTTNTPTAPGFNFGGTASAAPVANSTGAPTPSFAFGSTAANTPAPGPVGAPAPTTNNNNNTPAPAPTGAFSFGGGATPAPPVAPTTGGFSLSSTSSTPAPTTTTTTTATTTAGPIGPTAVTGFQVPEFHTIFPNEKIHVDIKRLLTVSSSPGEDGREAALELIHRLRCDNANNNNNGNDDKSTIGHILVRPQTLQYTPPDSNLRNQLYQNPEFVLHGKPARLQPEILREMFHVADDLRISEREAICLCGQVMQTNAIPILEAKLVEGSLIDQTMTSVSLSSSTTTVSSDQPLLGTNAVKAAKELYFYERQLRLRTILLLVQSRIEADQQPWGDLIIEATDTLLQNNLIGSLVDLVREWTVLIGRISQELAKGEANLAYSSGYSPDTKPTHFHFDMVHLTFAVRERQSAAESLFFLAYHTQLTAEEVASLIDLIKDLTNGIEVDSGLPLLNPFTDVPSCYENSQQMDQAWAPYSGSLPVQKQKGYLEWQRELVQKTKRSGRCELLRCASTLVMAVISALDTRNVFVDRNTHKSNQMGVGNMLLPATAQPGPGLDPIQKRLTSEGCRDWKRTDICGLLCGAYAMLLKAPSSLTSPRAGGGSPSRSRSLVRTFADCLSAPMLLKSITFAQISLLPALQRPSNYAGAKCDSSEFLLSVLSEFVANFLDVVSSSGNLPVSRASWKSERLEELQLERENQKQKREFSMWMGTSDPGAKEPAIPNTVDLMQRPDCMDDIIALAVAVASQGPLFALKFWDFSNNTDENGNTTTSLVPSRAYKQLKALATEDETLTSFYLAFSAALAKAECIYNNVRGADVVHSIFSSPDYSFGNWNSVFETLRWYIRTLDTSQSNSGANVTRSSGTSSTSYYYQNTSATNTSTQASSKSSPKPAEIGEANIFYLLSLLGLISSVGAKSPASRLTILSMQLPIKTQNSNTVLGSDPTLNILFSLLTAPLPPEVRGATLVAIASLLGIDGLDAEETTKMRKFAGNAWVLVESCQILPIFLLDQYPQAVVGVTPKHSGFHFPASSVSLAGTEINQNSPVPLDQSFSILYEMVHVEAKRGVYPSTEGFLSLLSALLRCCCPVSLGHGMRLRLGCTPYIEYVMQFVLPAVTGSWSKMNKLPFRSKADESRLFTKATEVIKTVLVQYSFEKFPDIAHGTQLLGQEALVENLVVADPARSSGNGFEDFSSKNTDQTQQDRPQLPGLQSPQPVSPQPVRGPSSSSIPSLKSPGFVVLADLLSLSDGYILKALSAVLANELFAFSVVGDESSTLAEAIALFKETPPTLMSAKHAGKNEVIPSSMRAQLLKGLRPKVEETMGYTTAIFWRERGVINALEILCAAAVREEVFFKLVNAAPSPLRIVPLLRFDKRPGATLQITSKSVQISRLQEVLLAARKVVHSLTDYVGYSATKDETDVSISMNALSLIYFLQQSLPGHGSIETICGTVRLGYKKLASAVAHRLLASFERKSSKDFLLLSLILNWIVTSLRQGNDSRLAYALLGLPDFDRYHINTPASAGGQDDCLGAILNMVNSFSFVIDRDTSEFAATCFEILVRTTDVSTVSDQTSLHQVTYCTDRLRSLKFWRKNLSLFLMDDSMLLQRASAARDPNVIHSMAWLLQGTASELHLMAGFCPAENQVAGLIDYIAPCIGELDSMLTFLFGPEGTGIESVVRHIPNQGEETLTCAPPQEAIRLAQRPLQGPSELTEGYLMVDEKTLLTKVKESMPALKEEELFNYQKWCCAWNLKVKLDCAAFHLSNTVRVLVGAALASVESNSRARADSMASLLIAVLDRLNASPGAQVSPMPALGLSFVALLLSREITSVSRDSANIMDDLRAIRDRLAQAIVISGREQSRASRLHVQERTAILGAALTEIVQALPYQENDLDEDLFLDCAVILTELSAMANIGEISPVSDQLLVDLNGRKIAAPTEATILARSSLATLVEILDQAASSPVESLSFRALSHRLGVATNDTCAKALLRRASLLDEGVILLLEKFLQGGLVGTVLMEEGLLEALTVAADCYMEEERALQYQSNQQNSTQRGALGFPSFLYEHLLLFRTLFVTSDALSEQHRRDLPNGFYSIVQRYQDVFARAFGAMSMHAKELNVLCECVAQASALLSNSSTGALIGDNPLKPLSAERLVNDGKHIESGIKHLCLHLAEHPFPGDNSSHLPFSLAVKSDNAQPSSFVPISGVKNVWWDSAIVKTSSPVSIENWTLDIFQHALLGIDVLNAGLFVLMKQPLDNFAVEMGLVRGYFQLTNAAKTVEQQLELLFDLTPQIDYMEMDALVKSSVPQSVQIEYLRKMGRKLNCCIHKVLLAIIHRVRCLKNEQENNLSSTVGDYCRALRDMLDHTEVLTHGIPCSVGVSETEQSKELGRALADMLIL